LRAVSDVHAMSDAKSNSSDNSPARSLVQMMGINGQRSLTSHRERRKKGRQHPGVIEARNK
jgi:hypothetical protein